MSKSIFSIGTITGCLLLCTQIGLAQEGRLPVVNDDVTKQVRVGQPTVVQGAQKVKQPLSREMAAVAGADKLVNNNAGATATSQFTQSETSIAAFGNNVIVAYNDAGSVAAGSHFTGWSYSSDGGATFTDGGALPNSASGDAGDPVLARNDGTGRIYLSTLSFSGVGTIQVFRSDDNGVTWSAPVNGTPGGSSEDKQWMVVDNFAGSGNGNVYMLSRRFAGAQGIYLFKSTDNGLTFGPTGGVLIASGASGNVQGAFIVVAPDHSLYAFYFDDVTDQIKVRKSTDFGATFGAVVIVASGLPAFTNGGLGLTGTRQGTATVDGFRSNSFPHAAINPINGDVYVTYNNKGAGADKADVFMVQSTTGGATWSAPVKVNDDATTTDQWQPTIAVMDNGTKLGIFYYSRQEDVANNNLFKYYGRVGNIAGSVVAFDPSFAVSDVAAIPEFGRDAVVNATYMGDYNFAVGIANYFHVSWADSRSDHPLPAGAPRKDPNVYYDKIFVGALAGKNINVAPTTINFGSVPLGNTAGPANIIISNIGDQPLTINSISNPGGDFALGSVPALPLTIPVSGSATFTVSYTANTAGPASANISIVSDAINTPTATVALQAFGLPPTNINVSPSPLVINLPYNGTGSGVFNIKNVFAFANNLDWKINDYVATNSNQPGGPAFSWTDITGTGTSITLGDDAALNVALPFTFKFYGANQTSVNIVSNGFLNFGAPSTQFTNAAIPTAAPPNNLVAGFWDDLNPAAGGTIHYLSSPSQFVVQYTNIRRFGTTNAETFQIILNADGSIKYQYLTMTGDLNSATVGIENATGTDGVQVAFNAPFVANNLAVLITPAPACSWITSISPLSGTTTGGNTSAVTVNADATGLNCGTYNCSVRVSSNAANAPLVILPVQLNVQSQFSCSIVSVPSNNVYTGGVPTNLYIGYGPQSTTLQSTVSGPGGPFTYSWSPATGLSSTTSAAPIFTPTAPGSYTFTLTVTGSGACATTCTITINVYDIRVPGTKKIYLCHVPPDNPSNAHTLEISPNAVPGHMPVHPGDRLGPCNLMVAPRYMPTNTVVETIGREVQAYPNPTEGVFELRLNNYQNSRVEVRILKANGVLVEKRMVNVGAKAQSLRFDMKSKANGLYLVQVIGSEGVQTTRVVVRQ